MKLNNYMDEELSSLKENIEQLSFFHQVEVLRILNEHNSAMLNENKNGVFINLTNVDKPTIQKLKTYLKYVAKQETHITTVEDEKKKLTEKFFNEGMKEEIFTCSKV